LCRRERCACAIFSTATGPETVVLVHGYASSGRLWQLTMQEMDPTRFRVIALNNRGARDSGRSPSEDAYTVETFAADLFNVVDALGLDGFTLVGHSMGGATCYPVCPVAPIAS